MGMGSPIPIVNGGAMSNKFNSIGLHRSLTYSLQQTVENGVPRVLLGYWIDNYSANAPWPGELIPPYMGEPMPNGYLDRLVELSQNEYFNKTQYSNAMRYTPPSPGANERRYRDCSSFIWDILDRVGFRGLGSYPWYTASQYQVLKEYQVAASSRMPGDIIIYWKTSGAPVGGNAEHTMLYIGNNWYIDVTGHTGNNWDACQQRNKYNLDSGYCKFFRIPPSMYPPST